MTHTVKSFNSLPAAERIEITKRESLKHFALQAIMYFPKTNVGVFYQRSPYAHGEIVSAIAFVLDIELKWYLQICCKKNDMQQCCKQQ